MKKLSYTQLQAKFEIAVANAEHPEIAPRLASWGYDQESRAADLDLLAQTRAARAVQQREASQADVAHKAKAQARKTARSGFVVLHRFLRHAARRHPDLDIPGVLAMQPLPKANAAFLGYTTALLDRIAAQPDIATALAELGYGQTKLDGLRDSLGAIREATAAQIKEQGEAERATAKYKALLEQVRVAYSYLKLIGKEALKDTPQLLEIIGIMAPS